MKRLKFLSLLAIVLVSTSGCARLGYNLGQGIGNDLVSRTKGRVEFLGTSLEKPESGEVLIRGRVKYNPATVGGGESVSIENSQFEFELTNKDGRGFFSFSAPLVLFDTNGVIMTALLKDQPLDFTVEQVISLNIWELAEGVKIKGSARSYPP